MTKYFDSSKHVPLDPSEQNSLKEQTEEVISEAQDGGQALQKFREKQQLTRKKLGKMVHLEESVIEHFETGSQPIPPSIAEEFGKIFHTNPKTFLV